MDSPFAAEHLAERDAPPVLLVAGADAPITEPGSLPVVVACISARTGDPGPVGADLVVDEDGAARLVDLATRNPVAAVTLALVLRTRDRAGLHDGLSIESTAYSALQAGPEFARWRESRPVAVAVETVDAGPTVLVDRTDGTLSVTLNSPGKHNAISARMRDELDAALAVAEADDTLRSVILTGAGPSFCSGGDLDEFGSRPDPATAHRTRLLRSPARRLARLADRTAVVIHGAAMGGGIELAAFASRVTARPDVRIALPEVSLGLIPGAGGTVSVSDRIGRQRTAALCLALESIGASTALDWGLVDSVDDR